jgi:hypothetical protein
MSKRLNRAKCRLCQDVIVSKSRYDFVSCKCGEIFVDGGNDYWRRGAKNFNNLLTYNGKTRKWVAQYKKQNILIEWFNKLIGR